MATREIERESPDMYCTFSFVFVTLFNIEKGSIFSCFLVFSISPPNGSSWAVACCVKVDLV